MITAPPPLAADLVHRIERLKSASVVTMRDTVYEALGAAGVDVAHLVGDARDGILAERRAEAERLAALERVLKGRVQSGTLPVGKLQVALGRLRTLALKSKAYKEALRRLEARPLPQPASAPTRELVRHKGAEPVVRDREPGGQPLSSPRYEFPWAIDRMSVPLTAEQYQAAQRLRDAYLRRESTPKAVDWNGAGRSAPGPRLPISEAQQQAGREYNAVWTRLPPELRAVVANFLFEQPWAGQGRPLTPVEFGQAYADLKHKDTARGVTTGAVMVTCAVIARLFREYDEWRSDARRNAPQAQPGRSSDGVGRIAARQGRQ